LTRGDKFFAVTSRSCDGEVWQVQEWRYPHAQL
jgi:hypothetical protein